MSVMRTLALFLLLPGLMPAGLLAREIPKNEKKNPRLISISPLGGQVGSSLAFKLRGEDLQGIRKVWVDCDRLTAEVTEVQEIVLDKARFSTKLQTPGQEILIQVDIAQDAAVGAHSVRILTDWGLTGPLPLLVSAEAAVAEQKTPHHTPSSAQPLSVPGNLNGKIEKNGEVDYYRFEALENQDLQFEVLVAGGILAGAPIHFRDPELIIYEPSASWFDDDKARRLEGQVESTVLPLPVEGKILRPRLRHRFRKKGHYLLAVGSQSHKGGPGHNYQLRMAPVTSRPQERQSWTHFRPAHPARFSPWQERGFARTIHPRQRAQLWSRTVQPPPGSPENNLEPASEFQSMVETEPDESVELASSISLPIIIQGKIDRPGDVDHFRFAVKAGQGLAFEIETVERSAPELSLWLEVLDRSGRTVCSNIYRKVEANSAYWLKFLQSKTVFTFETEGEYTLRLRDLTSRRGGAGFFYRVLVRTQLPHVGVVDLAGGDHINLLPGEAKQITVTVEKEEGFDHSVALHFENLPRGVRALPTIARDGKSGRAQGPRGETHRDWFFPESQKVSVTLLADEAAPSNALPRRVRLTARAVVEGRVGNPFPVKDLFLTVVNPGSPKAVSQLASGE